MAFGKKKKQKEIKQPAPVMLAPDQNPLYPPKTESSVKEMLTAVATAVICLTLVGVIVVHFSYASGNYAATVNADSSNQAQIVPDSDAAIEDNSASQADTNTIPDAAEPKTEPAEEINSDYILADSNTRYISSSELENLSQEELRYARNEIYARHGRKFQDAALQSYFDSKEWYQGTIEPDQFLESMLNDFEIKNAETIRAYEQSKGY